VLTHLYSKTEIYELKAPLSRRAKGKKTYCLLLHLLKRFLKTNRAGKIKKSETICVVDKTNSKAYLL